MKFSREYTKLQDRIFTTVRLGWPYYVEDSIIVCETPTETFQARVLYGRGLGDGLDDVPFALLRYDTDSPLASREEIIEMILKLYHGRAPSARDVWTLYLLERLKVPDASKPQGRRT
jgi:hypothetical protein